MKLYMDNDEVVELVMDMLDSSGGEWTLGQIKETVRFEITYMTEEEVRDMYGYDMDEGQSVEDYLSFKTVYYGVTSGKRIRR